ncbi:MAG: radical SAM protein [bacterium]|nr:radical SAM protein [bacterium]
MNFDKLLSFPRKTKMYLKVKNKLKTPLVLIYFITNKCNMHCKHCFYWKSLSKDENTLNLEEIGKIAGSLKSPLSSILITGGEPFLHSQIVEICKTFYDKNKPMNFHFMTNGMPSSKIIETTESIFKNVNSNLHFQISIDGVEDIHDKIRGKEGCFNEAVKTLKELKKLSTKHPNLTVHILTVVSKLNYKHLVQLSEFTTNVLKIPITFEFARGNELFQNNPLLSKSYNPSLPDKTLLTLDEMKKTYNEIKKIYTLEKSKLAVDLSFSLLGLKKEIELIETSCKIVDCVAGNQIGVLYPDGKVAGCELIESKLNIRDFDLDFHKLWQSKKMDDFRKKIKNCYCIHGCFLQTSLLNSIKYGIFYHPHP